MISQHERVVKMGRQRRSNGIKSQSERKQEASTAQCLSFLMRCFNLFGHLHVVIYVPHGMIIKLLWLIPPSSPTVQRLSSLSPFVSRLLTLFLSNTSISYKVRANRCQKQRKKMQVEVGFDLWRSCQRTNYKPHYSSFLFSPHFTSPPVPFIQIQIINIRHPHSGYGRCCQVDGVLSPWIPRKCP